MSDDINYQNNPLHGLSLKNLLIEIVDHYGFEILYAYLNINCFKMNPSIESSVKFLKKTEWAREKIESFYLYQYKNLPRASDEQFALPPRDRIIPDDQKPGEPVELSIEDAERLREKKAKRAAERKQSLGRDRNDKIYGRRSQGFDSGSRKERDELVDRDKAPRSQDDSILSSESNDPWSKWR